MLQIKTVLVPTDFSSAAEQALHVARSLARDHGAKLVLVTSPLPPPTPLPNFVYDPGVESVGNMEHSRLELNRLAATITDLPVETQVVGGPPGPGIVQSAKGWNADLIVMGTHGRSGLSRLLMGSVAEHVVRHAACPVLTIKPAAAPAMGDEESKPT
jgi:nucleotide-binding universal stress UspA family protein